MRMYAQREEESDEKQAFSTQILECDAKINSLNFEND